MTDEREPTWHIFSRRNQHGKRFYFNLTGVNGERILASEGYHNLNDAIATVDLIRKHAASATVEIGQRPA